MVGRGAAIGMGLFQRWMDEPEERIARFAAWFYLLSFVFLAAFGYQVARLMLRGDEPVVAGDVAGPLVSLLVFGLMFTMALDGRRSYKALKASHEGPVPGIGSPKE